MSFGASEALNSDDRYSNSLSFVLPSDQHALRLGIRKQQTVDADWVAYDHFQLRYLGSGTGIQDLHPSARDDHQAVYDLMGRRLPNLSVQELNKLPAGIYIIGGKKYISGQ
ncbi:MAG: hypothetical protein II570_09040 [Bacteroidaceae bacterium]|nr:hypothetical protein [Bacteroidaceae bacterium]